ncbi:hypothetical protein AVEN_60665-1 [Araneus ventricosus]|uniref:Uncharacterized protein n=1 Tax=Araneus ventricosus TaxID=182803 RepID=A0A4Y2H0V8_ARAVE|nr:hypothetical protein AVEN_60665-1 [Araneus ventricosus]
MYQLRMKPELAPMYGGRSPPWKSFKGNRFTFVFRLEEYLQQPTHPQRLVRTSLTPHQGANAPSVRTDKTCRVNSGKSESQSELKHDPMNMSSNRQD